MYKHIVGALACLVLMIGIPLALSQAYEAAKGTATLATSAPVAPVAHRPVEGDDDFNPCTMGVDGTYPESDPRYWTPGPCSAGTRLPFGGVFGVTVVEAPECVCPQGWLARSVRVHVDVNGVELAPVTRVACSLADDPFGGGVAEVLPQLYRESARIYWP